MRDAALSRMPDWLLIICAAFPPTAAAALGWWKFYLERKDKRRAQEQQAVAEKAKADSEAAMREIKRRSTVTGPYFVPSECLAGRFEVRRKEDPSKVGFIWAGTKNVLNMVRSSVDDGVPAGADVILLVDNKGAEPIELEVGLESHDILGPTILNNGLEHVKMFVYAFDPERRGKRQTIDIGFLSRDGVRDVHRYETKHGERWLTRIDPT